MVAAAGALTFALPNFVGELFSLTPTETPFLSMIGGLTGGRSQPQTRISWQTETNTAASIPSFVEGDDTTFAQIGRTEVINATQIFQYGVELSYTKQGAYGNLGDWSTRVWSATGDQPVKDELAHQLMLKLRRAAYDMELAFLTGTLANPVANTARQTAGLATVVTTNTVNNGTAAVGTTWDFDFTGGAQEDLWTTAAAHGLVVGDEIQFTTAEAAPAEYVAATSYWVVAVPLATTVQLSATKGGAVLAGTADATAGNWVAQKQNDLTKANIDSAMKQMADSGAPFTSPVILANSWNKQMFSSIYGYAPEDRTLGGVNINTVMTDFATVGVVYDRYVPTDTVFIVDVSECAPVFMPIPGKGHFFVEPIAKAGAYDRFQLYGEAGLEYGAEQHHAVITGVTSES